MIWAVVTFSAAAVIAARMDWGSASSGVYRHHGGDALGHGGGGDDDDLFFRQAHCTAWAAMMMFLLLGRTNTTSRWGCGSPPGGCRRWRGVHGLAAGHDAVHAQVAEHVRQPIAGAHRQKPVALLRRGHSAGAVLQLLLDGVQVIGALQAFCPPPGRRPGCAYSQSWPAPACRIFGLRSGRRRGCRYGRGP